MDGKVNCQYCIFSTKSTYIRTIDQLKKICKERNINAFTKYQYGAKLFVIGNDENDRQALSNSFESGESYLYDDNVNNVNFIKMILLINLS